MPLNIIRAWKDRDYRNSLNKDHLVTILENQVSSIDLAEEELACMQGGDDDELMKDGFAVLMAGGVGLATVAALPAEIPVALACGIVVTASAVAGTTVLASH